MTVTCENCNKEMESYPFSFSKLCLKCVMETKFEKYGEFRKWPKVEEW